MVSIFHHSVFRCLVHFLSPLLLLRLLFVLLCVVYRTRARAYFDTILPLLSYHGRTLLATTKTRMGNRPGGKRKLQHDLFKNASHKFDSHELKELKIKFKTLAELSKGPTVDKKTFLKVFPLGGILGERMFTLFDVDESGVLDYEEFVVGLAFFCRGTQRERLRIMFNMYDLAGDGSIHKQELSILLRHMPKELLRRNLQNHRQGAGAPPPAGQAESLDYVDVNHIVDLAFESCDLNKDGKLSFEQFNLWVTQNPDLADWFNHQLSDSVFNVSGILGPGASGATRSPTRTPTLSPSFSADNDAGHNIGSLSLSPALWGKFGLHCDACKSVFGHCVACGAPYGKGTIQAVPGEDGAFASACGACGLEMRHLCCSHCGKKFQADALSERPGLTKGHSLSTSSQGSAGGGATAIKKAPSKLTVVAGCKSGWLYKKGGRFGAWKHRFYWIDGKFCYYTKHGDDMSQIEGAIYLEGSYVRKKERGKEDSKYYGIEIRQATGGERDVRWLFTVTERERESWLGALQDASRTRKLDAEYKVLEEIGVGRFANVYKCKHLQSGEDFAVKVMKKNKMSARDLELLRTEIAVMKLVQHPNVITLRDIFETETKINIVMELVRGGELFQHIVGRKRFSELEAFKLIRPVADALRYIHNLGIVHRDLKPENILCEKGLKNIRIADFGLSQLVAPTKSLKLACGTLSYVAPEILLDQGYSMPADIWSLGIIAFLVLRGKLPYTASTEEATVENIKQCKNVIDLEDKYWKPKSLECCDVISRMLEKDPITRITADEILAHEWSKRMSKELAEEEAKERSAAEAEVEAKGKAKGKAKEEAKVAPAE